MLVHEEFNYHIKFGGRDQSLIKFRIKWHQDPFNITLGLFQAEECDSREEPFRLARTLDSPDTEMPSRCLTRIHTPGDASRIRHYPFPGDIGRGAFGVVRKTIDVDSGMPMAVKIVVAPKGSEKIEAYYRIQKREIEALSQLGVHQHIVKYLATMRSRRGLRSS